MKNVINKASVLALLTCSFISISSILSAESRYEIRADGLACPYCAYGIEKKFMAIEGVNHVDFDLKKGLVLVTGENNLQLNEPQLKTLFSDSGFTFRQIVNVVITE